MKRFLLALLLVLLSSTSQAQLLPYFPSAANPAGSNGQLQYNNNGSMGGLTAGGDLSLNTATGAFTVNQIQGTPINSVPASGNLVGTTDSQTLSGKTLSSPILTGSMSSAAAVTLAPTNGRVASSSSANPTFQINYTAGGADLKNWDFQGNASQVQIQASNDALNAATTAYVITRGTTYNIAGHFWYTSSVAGTPVQQMSLSASSLSITPNLIEAAGSIVSAGGPSPVSTGPASNQGGVIQVNVIGTSSGSDQAGIMANRWTADANATNFVFTKSRGATAGANTAVQAGDRLGNVIGRGADGTNYPNAAVIEFGAEGGISTGIVPGNVIIATANSSGALTNALKIDSSQVSSFFGGIAPKSTVVASLPSCAAGTKGQVYAVTDATAPTYGSTLTGGGSIEAIALCDGTNWTAH